MGGQVPPWMQGLQQGLQAQRPMPMRPPMQGGPQGMPPQGMPMQGAPPGAGYLRDQDAIIRAALARRGRPMPVAPEGGAMPQGMPQQGEPDADERGGMPDGDQDDPRIMRGYR